MFSIDTPYADCLYVLHHQRLLALKGPCFILCPCRAEVKGVAGLLWYSLVFPALTLCRLTRASRWGVVRIKLMSRMGLTQGRVKLRKRLRLHPLGLQKRAFAWYWCYETNLPVYEIDPAGGSRLLEMKVKVWQSGLYKYVINCLPTRSYKS